jgi:hypothetical protein
MTPTTNGDGNIYFRLHEHKLSREDFHNMLQVFRDFKQKRLVKFDWESKMWKMEETAIEEDNELANTLRERLRKAGIYLRRIPGEDSAIGARTDGVASESSFEAAVESILDGDSYTVAITKQAGAFLILAPNSSNPWEEGVGSDQIHRLIQHELSGVTDLIEHEFDLPGRVNFVPSVVYQTYDVWLVAELLQLLSEQVIDVEVVVSDTAQEALGQRFADMQQRRRPIPEIEKVRNPDVPLHPHQIEGVRFFMDNGGRGLLGDEMGLGK